MNGGTPHCCLKFEPACLARGRAAERQGVYDLFNILVSYRSDAWEHLDSASGSMSADRFKEYSGIEASTVSIADPKTLKSLEGIPTLLMYEVDSEGPCVDVV